MPRSQRISPATRPHYRIIAAAVSLGVVGSLLSGGMSATAATTTPSELIIKWTGDSSTASQYQPARNASSPHYAEFKDITIKVSQTQALLDQAIRVTVSGFAGTISSPDIGNNAMNFVQAMQCWGDNPNAANFRETCQWGGRTGTNSGLGTSVYGDNALRLSPNDVDAFTVTTFDNPFRTVDGATISAKNILQDPDGGGPLGLEVKVPLLDILDPTVTNEVTSARINADGTGFFDFETQSSDQAPQMGCGRTGQTRCWLVIVPRGTVYGGVGAECSSILDPNTFTRYSKWETPAFQGGSPINPKCDYWDNRIVVPLDFAQTGTGCKVGGSEVRVIGSQMMVSAMSSWQPELCRTLTTTYSFATNPDAVARAQTLDGLAPVAFTGLPLSSGELETEADRQKLASSRFAYVPTAISSVVVAFNAEFGGGREEQMVLSPRIMAKFLTQSYRFTVPSNSSDPDKNVAHLAARNQAIRFLFQDPEFQALNPTNYQKFLRNPSLVLPGPSGADALRQLWRWIQADADAVAFLDGTPDPSGMSVNPYYLPKGNPAAVVPTFTEEGEFALDADGNRIMRPVGLSNIDGSPQKLSTTPVNLITKADESLVPLKLTGERSRFDTLQFSPYTDSLLSGARLAFRANPNSKSVWDPNRVNSSGDIGDWVSGGVQAPGQRFVITIADGPSAIRYGLSVASLRLPNSTEVSTPSAEALAASMSALTATSLDSVKQIDPSKVTSGGYPLTLVTYAVVNLTKSTPTTRASVTSMLKQVTTSGQKQGSALGELPEGYLPLTGDLTTQAASQILSIQNYTATTTTTTTTPTANQGMDTFDPGTLGIEEAAAGADPTITEGADTLSEARTSSSSSSLLNGTLVFALVLAASGFLLAPLLLRGGRSG